MWRPENEKNGNTSLSKIFNSTYGHISFAAFVIAAVSGILLAIPYNVLNPLDSLSFMLITNPGGVLFRNIHYWSAQVFLIFFLLHIYDHLRKFTERKVKTGVWLRLTFSILVTFFIMLSGFILKGDADSIHAKSIITSLINLIPLIGRNLTFSLFGSPNNYQILYVHHIATATIFLWIIIVEHARVKWPKLRIILYLLPIFILIGYLLPPALHDGMSPITKGPWYFLGLQEILHWMSYPILINILIPGFILVIAYLPKYSLKWSVIAKKIIFVSFIAYSFLIIIGYYFRGEDWQFTLPWKNPVVTDYQFTPFNNISIPDIDLSKKNIPTVLGRKEGCLTCHTDTKGFSPAHDPEAIGCVSCHLGDPFTLNKTYAHKGMINIPGNLDVARQTCGTAGCHSEVVNRVDKTLMTTMSGVVSVDKYAFGETKDPNTFQLIAKTGHSTADEHLRNLCASCHLGGQKKEFGPITQLSRGGGCNACHLNYSDSALTSLTELQNKLVHSDSLPAFTHPSLSLKITNDHCFGCHSRSGRISTNYEGWHDTLLQPEDVKDTSNTRVLDDGRIFARAQSDIHHEKGMECIDCHTSHEVMGDGKLYLHEEDQVKISCTDCHFNGEANTKTISQVDQESQRIIYMRNLNKKDRKFLVVKKSGFPLINTYLNEKNEPELITKNNGWVLPMKPPAEVCTEGEAHSELSCESCHTSWATQCIGCHTQYNRKSTGFDLLDEKETKGDWMETPSYYLTGAPTLGIKMITEPDDSIKNLVDTFIPGMILTIHKKGLNPKSLVDKNTIFRRFYAPASPHTITKEGRSCESCHNDPVALGYGRGKLDYVKQGNSGRWIFSPKFPLIKYDGLPEDAWIGFLKTRNKDAATRTNVRPFNVTEQKKILTVGACLTCHNGNSRPMKEFLDTGNMPKVSPRCLLPKWD